jgi:membrane-bound ClpP family serine protease
MNLETIYTVCAVAGGTILVLRLVLMLIGLDQGDSAGDSALDQSDHGAEHSGAFTFLSLQSIAGFFTMFGLVGLGLLRIQVRDWLSLLGGMAAGTLTAWATGMIFLSMRRLQSEGTLDIRNAMGQVGTVYLTIPAEGTGVVNVTVQGTLRTMDAVSEDGTPIATGKIVQVVGISAGKILVVRAQTADKR